MSNEICAVKRNAKKTPARNFVIFCLSQCNILAGNLFVLDLHLQTLKTKVVTLFLDWTVHDDLFSVRNARKRLLSKYTIMVANHGIKLANIWIKIMLLQCFVSTK